VGIAAVVALALSSVFGSGSGGLSTIPTNAVGVIDPESNKVVGAVAVGVSPEAIAVGAGAVWVANVDDEIVSRIDPGSRRLIRNIKVDGYPSDLTVHNGSVWVALGPLAMLSRIAQDRDRATRPFPAVGEDLACRRPHASLVAGRRALWFACETGEVGRVDPRTRKSLRVGYDAGLLDSQSAVLPQFSDIAFGLGSIWLADRAANTITEIDPSTNRRLRTITVGRGPTAVAVGPGSVWVADFDDDTVTRIHIRGHLRPVTTKKISIGDGPVDVAVAEGGVWVANSRDGTVSRIDPSRNAVVATIEAGNEPRRLALAEGMVWVSVQARAAGGGS
jgi:YVTN family beta-propeller protein